MSIPTLPPRVYVTNHQHSQVIGTAFSKGCEGQIVPPHSLLSGPAVVYGILRGCGEIIRQCEWVGRDYYHIDHGYIGGHDHYGGYYRVSKNGLQANLPEYFSRPPDRFERLNIKPRPWARWGQHIVVCPLTGGMANFLGIDPTKWLEAVTAEISQWTDRPIIVKPKGEGSLDESLKDAWCLVTHTSNAAVDAIVSGVPAIVLGPSVARPVSWHWRDIESPRWPDREPWLHELAYHQFTLSEMQDGTAWRILNGNG